MTDDQIEARSGTYQEIMYIVTHKHISFDSSVPKSRQGSHYANAAELCVLLLESDSPQVISQSP
jgi:hypothetical protein